MPGRGTFLTPTVSAVIDLAEPGGEYTDPRLADRGREMLAALKLTVQAAYARGIPIAAGTDTSYTPASLSSVVTETKGLANLGLPKLAALRAATIVNASRRSPCDREIGRLRPGYAADAVVVGANPLDDLAALDYIRLIVAGGWIAREGPLPRSAGLGLSPGGLALDLQRQRGDVRVALGVAGDRRQDKARPAPGGQVGAKCRIWPMDAASQRPAVRLCGRSGPRGRARTSRPHSGRRSRWRARRPRPAPRRSRR